MGKTNHIVIDREWFEALIARELGTSMKISGNSGRMMRGSVDHIAAMVEIQDIGNSHLARKLERLLEEES